MLRRMPPKELPERMDEREERFLKQLEEMCRQNPETLQTLMIQAQLRAVEAQETTANALQYIAARLDDLAAHFNVKEVKRDEH